MYCSSRTRSVSDRLSSCSFLSGIISEKFFSLQGMKDNEKDISIVFDLGGVIFDWNPRHLYRKLFQDDHDKMEWFLSNICTQDWNVKQDAGRPFSEAVAELVALYPDHEELI